MKIRTDFVSNSSSSSFIVKDKGHFFESFNITAKDVKEAIEDLMEKSRKELEKTDGKKSAKSYTKFFVKNFKKISKSAKEKFFKEWDWHFAGWDVQSDEDHQHWDDFICALENGAFDVKFKDFYHGPVSSIKNRFEGKKYNKSVVNFINDFRNDLQIRTMKDVLHDDDVLFVIHFSDNAIGLIDGFTDVGKPFTLHSWEWKDKETQEESLKSKWETENFTEDRFWEILIKYLIEKKKINLKDKRYMDAQYLRTDDNTGKKSYWCNNPTWENVVAYIDSATVMHEG